MHQVDQVAEHRGFDDLAIQHAVEFRVAQHRDFTCCRDVQERLVKQPQQVPHGHDPNAVFAVQ